MNDLSISPRPACSMFFFAAIIAFAAATPAMAWDNLVKDPGFEAYKLDRRGFYYLDNDEGWAEISMGKGSVQLNANQWHAPDDMLAERPLGFSPGTTGFEGTAPDQNSGHLIMQQDILKPELLGKEGQFYEAWVWLGGGGRDNNNGDDTMKEVGGWEIFWYGNTDTDSWKQQDAIEYHHMQKNFFGKAGSFVQVAGFGRVPAGAKGLRLRVWASTWSPGSGPADFRTEVALDNAHVALIDAPNMLVNGDFELDDRPAEFKGWQRPADWPFPRNGMKVFDINNVYDENFDHSTYRPFWGYKYAYGYTTYLSGWGRDSFTFGQTVDYDLPDDTPLLLTFNWIQNVAQGGKAAQSRFVGTNIDVVVEYLCDGRRVGYKGCKFDWPVPANTANLCRYDMNCNTVYSPRMLLDPPKGTDEVGVHVSFNVNMPYKEDYCHMTAAVDDFYLVPLRQSQPGRSIAQDADASPKVGKE